MFATGDSVFSCYFTVASLFCMFNHCNVEFVFVFVFTGCLILFDTLFSFAVLSSIHDLLFFAESYLC
jgi:hypothetical protein